MTTVLFIDDEMTQETRAAISRVMAELNLRHFTNTGFTDLGNQTQAPLADLICQCRAGDTSDIAAFLLSNTHLTTDLQLATLADFVIVDISLRGGASATDFDGVDLADALQGKGICANSAILHWTNKLDQRTLERVRLAGRPALLKCLPDKVAEWLGRAKACRDCVMQPRPILAQRLNRAFLQGPIDTLHHPGRKFYWNVADGTITEPEQPNTPAFIDELVTLAQTTLSELGADDAVPPSVRGDLDVLAHDITQKHLSTKQDSQYPSLSILQAALEADGHSVLRQRFPRFQGGTQPSALLQELLPPTQRFVVGPPKSPFKPSFKTGNQRDLEFDKETCKAHLPASLLSTHLSEVWRHAADHRLWSWAFSHPRFDATRRLSLWMVVVWAYQCKGFHSASEIAENVRGLAELVECGNVAIFTRPQNSQLVEAYRVLPRLTDAGVDVELLPSAYVDIDLVNCSVEFQVPGVALLIAIPTVVQQAKELPKS